MTLKDLSYLYPAFPIVCSITTVLVMLVIPAHWRAGNIATVSLAIWVIGGLIIITVDTCVWHGNIRNPYPVWGDFAAAYFVMLPDAIAVAILCIQYRLWSIARARTVFITKRDKIRQKWVTYFMCWGVPLVLLGTHYIVQGHRYNLFEDVGPLTTVYLSPAFFPLYAIWEPLICTFSAIFAALTIRLFLARRSEFDAVLDSGSHNINKDRYLRLLFLAAASICIHLPLSLWTLFVNAFVYHVGPWKSWDYVHSNYLRIAYVTRFALSLNSSQVVYVSISCWAIPVCGILVFLFFGFGEEATKQYVSMLSAILRPLGIEYPSKKRKGQATKRSWLDVILCRPGRPVNLDSSAPTSSIPQFTTNPSSKGGKAPAHATTTTGTGNDLNLDISHLDFLDPAEARKQARISAYTRPGQAVKKTKQMQEQQGGGSQKGRRTSISSSVGGGEESDITDEKLFEPNSASSSTSTSPVKEEQDLEAQRVEEEPSTSSVAADRRRQILEAHPELTEEITF